MSAIRSPIHAARRVLLAGAASTCLLSAPPLRSEVGPPGQTRPDSGGNPPAERPLRPAPEETPVQLDLSGLESATTAWNAEARAWEFDGGRSMVRLDPGIPGRIGLRDFSILLEARLDKQNGHTAYIFEQHRDYPWTGLFLSVEQNQRLRFRLKDVPHCEVTCDVREWIGDGRFHEILLHRQGPRLEMVLDGVSRVAQVKPEHVDLDIDYNGNPLMVGAHCLGDDAFFHGALRGMTLNIGGLLDDEKLAALVEPAGEGDDEKLEALLKRLREGNAAERAEVARELKALEPRARRRLERYLDDPDPEVGETLREVLGK